MNFRRRPAAIGRFRVLLQRHWTVLEQRQFECDGQGWNFRWRTLRTEFPSPSNLRRKQIPPTGTSIWRVKTRIIRLFYRSRAIEHYDAKVTHDSVRFSWLFLIQRTNENIVCTKHTSRAMASGIFGDTKRIENRRLAPKSDNRPSAKF